MPTQPSTHTKGLEALTQLSTSDENRESILYKGPSGTGKTTNALTWPHKLVVAYFDKNQKTLRTALENGVECDAYLINSWKEFTESFLPAVTQRKFQAQTIVVDTIDFAVQLMWDEIQGTSQRLTMADFGLGLRKQRQAMNDLSGANRPTREHPGYNIVCTVHTMDVSDDQGGLQRIAPKMMGAFKDELEDYFDTVLLCESSVKSEMVNGKSEKQKVFFCHSIPPTKYHTCKGGNLPPQVGGTYQELRKAWSEHSG